MQLADVHSIVAPGTGGLPDPTFTHLQPLQKNEHSVLVYAETFVRLDTAFAIWNNGKCSRTLTTVIDCRKRETVRRVQPDNRRGFSAVYDYVRSKS